MSKCQKLTAGILGSLVIFGLVRILLAFTSLPLPHERAVPFSSFPPLKIREDFYFGKVVIVELDDANRLDIWVGEQLRGKQRLGNHALAVAWGTNANAVMTASFHWWTGRGFIVLGQVARDGESIVSPNADVLRWRRCFFATTWKGKFIIGETNLTTGRLLRQLPQIRHLLGGGGWLVKDGNPKAWLSATEQGFRPDITHSRRQRVTVGINTDGSKAWLVLFEGNVSLQECASWLHQNLPVHHAIFFDGGRNAVLVTRKGSENDWQIHYALTILPEVPCLLIVR